MMNEDDGLQLKDEKKLATALFLNFQAIIDTS